MREILFRGFYPCDGPETVVVDGEKVKGRWVEGDCITDKNGDTYITACRFIPAAPGYRTWTTLPVDCDHTESWVLKIDVPVFRVRSSTVGQYTGLTDSSGQKVFEGDILKFTDRPNDYEWTGRIEFGNPNGGYTWGYQIVHLSGPKPNIDTLCWFDMEEGGAYSEVIGTVFDEVAQHDN